MTTIKFINDGNKESFESEEQSGELHLKINFDARDLREYEANWGKLNIIFKKKFKKAFLNLLSEKHELPDKCWDKKSKTDTNIRTNITRLFFYLINKENENIVGSSSKNVEVGTKIIQVASTDCRVLITGESGAGKENVARQIFLNSLRNEKNYIPINCAAIPETLIESELFGHKKGAFTGATKDKDGAFKRADKGTLFLDEIADMSLIAQTKILRALEEGEFLPLGGTTVVKVDVRVILATNKNLIKEVKEGRFREDLFYRINIFPIHVFPLRERRDDIKELIVLFQEKFQTNYGRKITENIPDVLIKYEWPGNIRELNSFVECSVVKKEWYISSLEKNSRNFTSEFDEGSKEIFDNAFYEKILKSAKEYQDISLGIINDAKNKAKEELEKEKKPGKVTKSEIKKRAQQILVKKINTWKPSILLNNVQIRFSIENIKMLLGINGNSTLQDKFYMGKAPEFLREKILMKREQK